jgi:hypothetical protein
MGPGPDGRGTGDSWAAEQFRLVLEALRWNWGEAYEIGITGGLWYARRLDGRGTLEEGGPEKLRAAILKDYTALPVPRDLDGQS